jgi:hypothetical protein
MKRSISLFLLFLALLPGRARAQLDPLVDASVIYAAAVPAVDRFTPQQGPQGAKITIIGRNFRNIFDVYVGAPSDFTVVSPTQITATVRELEWPAGTKVGVFVRTRSGLVGNAHDVFTYAPTATIPNVVGMTLSAAEHQITQAKLTVGTITGSTAPSSLVISQNPTGGNVLPTLAKVGLTTKTPTTGLSGLIALNNLDSAHSVYVWLWDGTIRQWAVQNGGNLLAYQATSATITLATSHFYQLTAVDPLSCPTPTPDDSTCVPWQTGNPIPGDQNGPTVQVEIGCSNC